MTDLHPLRQAIASAYLEDDASALIRLRRAYPISEQVRGAASSRATRMVKDIRAQDRGGLMEVFLAEYGLSSAEGLALMRLAEALLRVPDDATVDALIEDKIVPAKWAGHRGKSKSGLVNASTLALMLTGAVLSEEDGAGIAGTLKGAVKRLGEPVIRKATRRAMKEMGNQFVLGETIADAVKRGRDRAAQGYTYSYDMLGEAAVTAHEADTFHAAYAHSIAHLAKHATRDDIRENPGISVKLSALHPRYEEAQRDRVMAELVPRVLELAQAAKAAKMGFNIDAEEADRLDLSLDVIEAVLRDGSLAGWDGFGVVVQAYGKRAAPVIDWLYALAQTLDRKIMVRLVKGAYWDTEIKRAQVAGLPGFPVYTTKAATDVSYLCCARQLLDRTDRLYPQFATHNAHTVASVIEMAEDPQAFEFQRLHGMGEELHDQVHRGNMTRCRIYAPVGAHRDLLAYLVRRLLENGANSSFVHKIMDEATPPEAVAEDPFITLDAPATSVTAPAALYAPERPNSEGHDLTDPAALATLEAARAPFRRAQWQAKGGSGPTLPVINPADPSDVVGHVNLCTAEDAEKAIAEATPWGASNRAGILNKAADLYESHAAELFALLAREAGKTLPDCEAELREAVDFLRYYAARIDDLQDPALGRVTCISPWNFPLAIFTGQIAAALAAGNAVLAKPAEATPLIAARAVALMHEAGVPTQALRLLPGEGATVGAALTSDPRIDGVAFTGSTATAQAIHRAMAEHLAPEAPLIAETGGLNAMIVDSTALPEQAVKDVVMSAFRSAGQRCSALRCLYVQQDIAPTFLKALFGAMNELSLGNAWPLATDIGPVIDARAQAGIAAHIQQARTEGRILHETEAPAKGTFIAPTAIRVSAITDLAEEVFGPVLHIATFKAQELDHVIDQINATGYGLTFGIHSRIDDRIADVTGRIKAGNLYVNRNQIGAIVGSQPFGGQGLSGTGPKAGGPSYVPRFTRAAQGQVQGQGQDMPGAAADLAAAAHDLRVATPADRTLTSVDLPGPTGETNRLTSHPRGRVLCAGPGEAAARAQARLASVTGCAPVLAPDLPAEALAKLPPFDALIYWGEALEKRRYREALAAMDGPILPLITEADPTPRLIIERHTCIDTTAAGGNAALLAAVA
ncbi:bifunctional proline dehydrogenase/L-glutamate gamma-semialdehyde dehydrogenase PutA [Rhodobacteraceae bacterium N5(2021)]|uniref:Bifunctional protein PutA n=1 Tax=Gymnodinialimonas phycosphaerae TaxID=2841589 RepID=A0A975TRD4_9RHOB|nr:bifunctional proline dehydrogenase/L-glutamate gamma-semialdehyde dehydrogenase PutA [Gymnodinialimonas phycosphaerae]MBY4893291.1 bifunctional proline dehydrogenase/L-glutamate gamma-semialdehyde dehydrogenase PutA [Gymnodinialimonas phycosphaerae]